MFRKLILKSHKGTPSLHNPAISHLYDKGWYAVETILPFQDTKHIIPHETGWGFGVVGILSAK